jgi:hypothetical protein
LKVIQSSNQFRTQTLHINQSLLVLDMSLRLQRDLGKHGDPEPDGTDPPEGTGA